MGGEEVKNARGPGTLKVDDNVDENEAAGEPGMLGRGDQARDATQRRSDEDKRVRLRPHDGQEVGDEGIQCVVPVSVPIAVPMTAGVIRDCRPAVGGDPLRRAPPGMARLTASMQQYDHSALRYSPLLTDQSDTCADALEALWAGRRRHRCDRTVTDQRVFARTFARGGGGDS